VVVLVAKETEGEDADFGPVRRCAAIVAMN